MTAIVICVMGLPASGKSTLCRLLSQSEDLLKSVRSLSKREDVSTRVEIVNFDELEMKMRLSVDGQACLFDPRIWRSTRERVSAFVREFRAADSDEVLKILLLDDNFYYKSMRKTFNPDGVIFVDTPLCVCLERNALRTTDRVPSRVIDNMGILLEVPSSSKTGYPVLHLDANSKSTEELVFEVVSTDAFWKRVAEYRTGPSSSTRPYPLPITEREDCLNQCEIALRKCISNFLNGRPHLRQLYGKCLSDAKRTFLKDFRERIKDPEFDTSIRDVIEDIRTDFTEHLISEYS